MKTYDPSKVVFVFLGSIITGFADGSFIKAARNEDTYKLTKGAGGEGCRSRSLNRSGKVTCTLMQSSLSNDILSAAQTLDELTGAGVGPLLIKDLSGTALVVAENAWIVKPADVDFAKEVGSREWIIECDDMIIEGGAIVG